MIDMLQLYVLSVQSLILMHGRLLIYCCSLHVFCIPLSWQVIGPFRGAVPGEFAGPAGSDFAAESKKLWDMSPSMVQKAYVPGSSSKTKDSNVTAPSNTVR
jgi:hypothetical protein